jgi:serine/threonine-protein kinase HipA
VPNIEHLQDVIMSQLLPKRVAKVFYSQRLVGVLRETDSGFSFTYDEHYLVSGAPIAFTLPFQQEAFESKTLPSFFENLVSEGWMRKMQARALGINEEDRFGLLIANGQDLVGAVTVMPIDEN